MGAPARRAAWGLRLYLRHDGQVCGGAVQRRLHSQVVEHQIVARRRDPRGVCDYISGMTDKYAVEKFAQLFMPMSRSVKQRREYTFVKQR